MSEWKEYRLGEVCIYNTERIPLNLLNEENYISTENMLPNIGGVTISSNLPTSGNAVHFYNGDILISNIRPYFKKIWYANKEGGCSADVLCIRANKDIDKQYLYYLLSQQDFFDYVMAGAKGCKMPRGDKQHIMNWEISLPSLPTQQKIASILSSLDDKIEINRRINEQLEELAQALFKSWFVDFEPFKDGDFVESELGMIPKGWTTISLSKMADYLNGLAMQKIRPLQGEKGLPVLKIKELGQDSCNETSELCSPSLVNEKYIVNDGDVIFSWSGTLLVKIWCGGVCGLNQHLFKVTSEKYPQWFIYLWTKYHLDRFIRIAKDKAVTMGHIKRGELDTSFAIVPNEEKMKEIDGLMAPLIEQIIANNIEIRHLTALRDTLLPKLMSGEIDVNEVEI